MSLTILTDDVHKTPTRCSQYYPGNKPFSTFEAQALRSYVHHIGDSINLVIHLHASFELKKVMYNLNFMSPLYVVNKWYKMTA